MRTNAATTVHSDWLGNVYKSKLHNQTDVSPCPSVTFSSAVSQNGSRSCLLALGSFARACLRAGGPGCPGAEDAVIRTRDNTRDRARERRFITQILVHFITCTHRGTFMGNYKLITVLVISLIIT